METDKIKTVFRDFYGAVSPTEIICNAEFVSSVQKVEAILNSFTSFTDLKWRMKLRTALEDSISALSENELSDNQAIKKTLVRLKNYIRLLEASKKYLEA